MAGIVAYSNDSKEGFLGVKASSLRRHGAVSRAVAIDMAKGIRHFACTDAGLGVTGVAGPAGGTAAKPVGLVHMALVSGKDSVVKEFRFKGSRQDIKWQASQAALDMIRLNI
jgi:PncC family amidohydrolase